MKKYSLFVLLLVSVFGWTQTDSKPNESPKSGRTVATVKDVVTIYIAPMANDLDQYLKVELLKKLKSRISIVSAPEEADAIISGTGEWQKGTGAAVTGRVLGLHDTATGAISMSSGNKLLWASEAGDRSIWWGALKRGGPRKVADRLANNLKDVMGSK
jgi:hypothetical protein